MINYINFAADLFLLLLGYLLYSHFYARASDASKAYNTAGVLWNGAITIAVIFLFMSQISHTVVDFHKL